MAENNTAIVPLETQLSDTVLTKINDMVERGELALPEKYISLLNKNLKCEMRSCVLLHICGMLLPFVFSSH